MKKLISLSLFYLLVSASHAQIDITGKVTDQSNGEPLTGVNIYAENSEKGTISDAEGNYHLIIENTEKVKVVFSFVGYEKKSFSISASQQKLDVSLVPDIQLEEIIIQSVRAEKRVPITQTTLSRKQIRDVYNGEDPQFFIEELTPSVLAYSESGTRNNNYGQMRLRGIGQERINITLNGIPLNDMIDHGVFFSNFTDFGNSIETVQVQRGVGTSSNGTSSYAGSINFESVNLQTMESGAEVQLGAGSFDSYRGSIEYKTGLQENGTSFYGRFSRISSDGYRYNSGTNSYSFFMSGGLFLEKDLFKINAFTGRSQNELAYTVVPESTIAEDPKTNLIPENDADDFGQHFVQLQHTHLFSNKVSLVSSLYYGGSGGDFPAGVNTNDSVYVADWFTTYPINYFQINYPLFNDHYGVMTNLHLSSPDNRWNIDAGLHAYTFRRQNLEQIVPDYDSPYYDERSHKEEFATFAKAEYQLNRFTIYGDLQLRTQRLTIEPDYEFMDTVNLGNIERNWTFLNPKIGVSWQIDPANILYLSYGRSGREPTKIDIFGGFQLNRSSLPLVLDQDLFQPEYVNDFETGIKLNHESLTGQVNLFYMQFNNEIAPIGEQIAFGVQKRRNIPSSYRAGLETDITWQFLPSFYITGNLTYMQSEIEQFTLEGTQYDNKEPILSPEWLVNGILGVKPLPNLEFQLASRYVSESYLELTNDPAFTLPSYFVLDSRIIYNFLDRFTLNLEVNNLLDQQYYSFGAPVDTDFDGAFDEAGYFTNAGTNFYITLTSGF